MICIWKLNKIRRAELYACVLTLNPLSLNEFCFEAYKTSIATFKFLPQIKNLLHEYLAFIYFDFFVPLDLVFRSLSLSLFLFIRLTQILLHIHFV